MVCDCVIAIEQLRSAGTHAERSIFRQLPLSRYLAVIRQRHSTLSVSLPNTNSTGGLAASCVTTNANDILLEQLETGTQNNSSGLAWIVTFQGFQQFGYLAETSTGTYATDTAFNGPSMCDAVIKGP